MSGVTESEVTRFFFARKAERKHGAQIDTTGRLAIAMRNRALAEELERTAERWAWERQWG
jgi:hypothetical protein